MAGRDLRLRNVVAGHSAIWRHGFTTIELVVVMVLVGILSAVAAAHFADSAPFQQSGFSEQSRAILRFAQKTAIAQDRPVYVAFNGESISLCFSAPASGCAAADQVQAPFAPQTDDTYCTSSNWYCLRRPASVTYAVTLGAVSPGAPRSMHFDGLGRPYDDTGAQFGAPMTLTVTAAGSPAYVNVEPETGYVH